MACIARFAYYLSVAGRVRKDAIAAVCFCGMPIFHALDIPDPFAA
jgi:hypothetical protein